MYSALRHHLRADHTLHHLHILLTKWKLSFSNLLANVGNLIYRILKRWVILTYLLKTISISIDRIKHVNVVNFKYNLPRLFLGNIDVWIKTKGDSLTERSTIWTYLVYKTDTISGSDVFASILFGCKSWTLHLKQNKKLEDVPWESFSLYAQ